MNRKAAGDGVGERKKKPIGSRVRDKDEDLMLFREMQRQAVSLLQPVSEEFEAHGHYALCGMEATGKKGHHGLGENGKNDYDWLKTPPATPLFPSLDMEERGPEFVIQRELPIMQPLSRFSGNSGAENGHDGIIQPTKSQNLKPKVPLRFSTPTGRPSVSLPEKKNVKSAPSLVNLKPSQSQNDLNPDQNPKIGSSSLKTAENKDANWNMNMGQDSSTKATKPKSKGVLPLERSRLSVQIAELSDQTPPNLRTGQSTSASRPRSSSSSSQRNPPISQKRPESVTKTRGQASSPASTRGPKQYMDESLGYNNDKTRTQVFGSRMVDRFLNARMSGAEDRKSRLKLHASLNEGSDARKSNTKFNTSMNEVSNARRPSNEVRPNNTKFTSSLNESSGFGRLMSKNSLDMALRHMKVQDLPRDAGISHKQGATATTGTGRRASSVSKRPSAAT